MFNFEIQTPTRIVFGRDTDKQIGEELKKLNVKKILIHYGGNAVHKLGVLDNVKKILDENSIEYIELDGVVPNPRLSLVYKGIEICKKENIDLILAIGGGSVIDSAKAIGYGVANDGDVWDLYEHIKKAKATLPVGVILTIVAAGSEMSNSSVITNENNGEKRAYDDDIARPKFAIMNPDFTKTLPAYQTASGCVDIMMHTMERYFTNGGNMELTDNIAEALLRTVLKYAKILRDNPENYDARAEIMWASSLSHNGLTGCGNDGGDFASHMLEHEIGGMFDVTHGAGLAAIWGTWARYVYKNCLPRFKRFALNVMEVENNGTDEEIAIKGIEAMEDFYRFMKMPTCFSELGIEATDEQLKELAKRCSITTGGHIGSAKVLYEEDMYHIYKLANK